jgi:hypothetical protein
MMARGAKPTTGDDARSAEVVPNARAAAVYLHVSELKPNPRNPRVHGPEVLKLARTILRTAWGAPIVAQLRSRRIIGGHGRLLAAQEILAGIEVDGEFRGGAEHRFDDAAPGPGMVPVRLVDVSDAEADAMTLADNAGALQGHDDSAAIVAMAASFGRSTSTLADIGLSDEALDRLVARAGDVIIGAERSPEDAFGALPDGDKPPGQHMAFQFTDEQAAVVLDAIARAPCGDGSPSERRASALAGVCEAYCG